MSPSSPTKLEIVKQRISEFAPLELSIAAVRSRHYDQRARMDGWAFDKEQRQRSRDRLVQAVSPFSKLPWTPNLPPVGQMVHAEQIAGALDCSKGTAWKLIGRAGICRVVHHRGWYATTEQVVVIDRLVDVCTDHCRRPRRMARNVVEGRA